LSRRGTGFDGPAYLCAAEEYRKRIEWSDGILYRMCKGDPQHAKVDRVQGKLSLIGRSYATGLERLLKTDKKQSGNLNAWVDYFGRRAKTLDSIVVRVRRERAPLDPDKLWRIAELHGEFSDVLRAHESLRPTKSGKGKLTPTSFVSKYLHFHNPVVPIYDSWAAAGARRHRLLGSAKGTLGSSPEGSDPDYGQFLRRFWCVYQAGCEALGYWPSVRHLDRYLLEVEESARTPKKPN
jgi:hypothetical protein